MDQEPYLVKYEIGKTCNPWQGLTDNYQEEASSMNIQAVPIEETSGNIPLNLTKYNRQGYILLCRQEDKRRVVINRHFFSDIFRLDATKGMNDEHVIGFYKDLNFLYLHPRELAEFLIESQIIITYIHIESHLYLSKEEENDEFYTALFYGYHIYFTNQRHEAKLGFLITIDKKSGAIRVSSYD